MQSWSVEQGASALTHTPTPVDGSGILEVAQT
jgi:hypothetical protein